MQLALFDLDNTLLAGDSDHLWGEYLAQLGVVDSERYAAQNEQFYADYTAGVLDIHAFARFSLGRLAEFPMSQLLDWRSRYLAEQITPRVASQARSLLAQHRAAGHTLVIITATNRFLTEPIAQQLDVPHLIATDPVIEQGHFTGEIDGTPCFQSGKIAKLNAWLQGREEPTETWAYSDSINDLPLLEWADHPHAVDACPQLRRAAAQRGWPQISLRG